MQQQAAIMASVAQGGYLNPMAAFAAAQMQQMAALNMNGLAAAPMTPTSGTGTAGWRGRRAGKRGHVTQDLLALWDPPQSSRLSSQATSGRTRGKGLEWHQESHLKKPLERVSFFVKHCNRLPRAVNQHPSLELFKRHVDVEFRDMV